MQAVINASGEGTRMRPLSSVNPPFMLSILDKPLIKRTLEGLKKHSVRDILIITGYMGENIKNALGDGKEMGLRIRYIPALFTDGVLKAYSHLLQKEFIYISRPVYSFVNYTRLMDYHRRKGAYVTVASSLSTGDNMTVSKEGVVTKIGEKQLWSRISKGENGLGIYLLNKDIVHYIPEETNVELCENIFPAIIRSGKSIYAHNFGEGEAIWDLSSYMRSGFLCLDKRREGATGIIIEEGAIVEKGALLETPCYIGKNAHIHKGAKIGAYSIVGKNTTILERVTIKRGIVGEGCRIEENASLRGCVVDNDCRIGENSCVYEQAVIGQGSRIGKNCVVKSFVKVWPEKETEDNVTLWENIMWGQRKRKKLFENGVIEGTVNVDITPRFATMLGECIGFVSCMGDVGISTDGSPAAFMIREGIVAGLTGQGARVTDFGEQPLAITRRAVMFYMLKAAVVINVFQHGSEERANITIIWEEGVDIDENIRARLEELYEKGEFLYPESKNIREAEYHFEYKLYYLKSIISSGGNKNMPMKILLHCPTPWGRRLITSAMSDFCSTVCIYHPHNAFFEKQKFEQAVRDGGFNIGFILDEKCESLTVALPEKGILKKEAYEALCALIVMKKYHDAKIFVPVTASSAVEKLAKIHGATVVRTKSSSENMMKHLSGKEEYLSDQFVFRYDGVGAAIKLVEFITERSISPKELLGQLPPIEMAREDVRVQENARSYMEKMREFEHMEENNPEGVKIIFDKGWVVVVPDAYKEVFHVVAEGAKAEIAQELCHMCIEKLKGN